MEIEPIASVDGLTGVPASEALLLDYLHQLHASPAQIALAEAQAKSSETTEELAEDGDPIALLRLQQDEDRSTPAAVIPHPDHPTGPHEDGKGDVIDIYD